MAIHYRTLGFIFKKEDLREADRIFTVYTEDFGKLELLAKAERKIKSKLRGGLESFYLSEIEFIQGKVYKTLTDTILIESFKNLRKDLKALSITYKVSEVLDNLVKGEEPDEKIWDLLNETFKKLDDRKLKIINHKLIYYYFLWNFLSILGYEPELNSCVVCQKKLIPERLYFNLEEGGIICGSCFGRIKTGIEIKPETIKILRILLKKDWETLLRLKIEPVYQKSLKDVSGNYYSHILGGYKNLSKSELL